MSPPNSTFLEKSNALSISPKAQKNAQISSHAEKTIDKLKEQNLNLAEALLKIQKSRETEKKCFHEILFGIDKALSSLPIRLEKIRVRNQRNLCIINSAGFQAGDATNKSKDEVTDFIASDDSVTLSSQESEYYISSRMKRLLEKIDQLNCLIDKLKCEDSSSPIEMIVNTELYAISLLKKEIKCTKKQIEDSKTDTETIKSTEIKTRDVSAKDPNLKAKNSFSNELYKASNFKIFENHMILQEEAMNLLTRKIRETEEALKKKTEEKENLQRENEILEKEVIRLKSVMAASGTAKNHPIGENLQKLEKFKGEASLSQRPYRLIKELKAKLEKQEKSLCTWKSKTSRLNYANLNKAALLEFEKKKNFELETFLQTLKLQNKALTSQANSMQYLNVQLRDQIEILKREVEVLANELLESQKYCHLKKTETLKSNEQNHNLEKQEKNSKEVEKKKEIYSEKETKIDTRLKKSEKKNEEFLNTFKKLIRMINDFGVDRDIKSIHDTSYTRVREILHITPSDLELLLSVYTKNSLKTEVDNLYEECKEIVEKNENNFSSILSSWTFDIIKVKLLSQQKDEKEDDDL